MLVVLIPNRWDPIVETICYKRFLLELRNHFELTFLEYFSNSSRDLKLSEFASIFQWHQYINYPISNEKKWNFAISLQNMRRTKQCTVHLSKYNLFAKKNIWQQMSNVYILVFWNIRSVWVECWAHRIKIEFFSHQNSTFWMHWNDVWIRNRS